MKPVLSHGALTPGENISTEQAIEINHHHYINYHHGAEKVSTVVQPGVIADDVPGEVELST